MQKNAPNKPKHITKANMKCKSLALAILILSLKLLSCAESCFTCDQPHTPNVPVIGGGGESGSSSPSSGRPAHCPRDALKLGICAKVLNGPVNAIVGTPPSHPCCSVIAGLLDLEAAVCLCTAIKANILGLDINIPIVLNLIVNACGQNAPSDFQCD